MMQGIQPPIPYRSRLMDALATVGRGTLALALALLALANLVDALVIHPWVGATFGEQAMDLDALGFGRAEAAMLSAILLLVARALAHGKRQAWSIAASARPNNRKSTRLNSSHTVISYAVFCFEKKNYAHRHT